MIEKVSFASPYGQGVIKGDTVEFSSVGVSFSLGEIEQLRGVDRDRLKAIFEIKKVFGGEVLVGGALREEDVGPLYEVAMEVKDGKTLIMRAGNSEDSLWELTQMIRDANVAPKNITNVKVSPVGIDVIRIAIAYHYGCGHVWRPREFALPVSFSGLARDGLDEGHGFIIGHPDAVRKYWKENFGGCCKAYVIFEQSLFSK